MQHLHDEWYRVTHFLSDIYFLFNEIRPFLSLTNFFPLKYNLIFEKLEKSLCRTDDDERKVMTKAHIAFAR